MDWLHTVVDVGRTGSILSMELGEMAPTCCGPTLPSASITSAGEDVGWNGTTLTRMLGGLAPCCRGCWAEWHHSDENVG